jgi:hypothetical protein
VSRPDRRRDVHTQDILHSWNHADGLESVPELVGALLKLCESSPTQTTHALPPGANSPAAADSNAAAFFPISPKNSLVCFSSASGERVESVRAQRAKAHGRSASETRH